MTKEELIVENKALREIIRKQEAIIEAVEAYIDYYSIGDDDDRGREEFRE